jgi:hypothetical protein
MPTEITIPYIKSEGYRTVLVDGVVIAGVATGTLDRVVVHLSRIDDVPTAEKAILRDDGVVDFESNAPIETARQKTVEFSAEMRPDTALRLVRSLLITLARLPDARKALYGIPKDLSVPEPVAMAFPT